jgi:hypothetical protein
MVALSKHPFKSMFFEESFVVMIVIAMAHEEVVVEEH